jgi:dipeptidyl-peptidase-4
MRQPVRRIGLGVAVGAVVACAALGCRGEAKRGGAALAGSGSGSGASAGEPVAWPALDETALAALQTTERFELGAPVPLAIAPDGAVVFRRSKPRDRVADLYQLDAAGKETLLASAAALAAMPTPAGPAASSVAPGVGSAPPAPAAAVDLGAGIDAIDLSDDGARVLVALAGRLFAIDRATAAARELAIGPHSDPRLSPDGARVAFVRDGDLWVAAIDDPRPVRLAQHPADERPGDRGARSYATPDTEARAFGRDRGFWWSPDSQSIAFERCDARAVAPLALADPRRPEQPPAATRTPLAGAPIATVDLGIVSIRGGAPRWVTWDLVHYPYLARVIWPAAGPLTIVAVGREQTLAAVITVDAATGAARPILVENDRAWVNLAPDSPTWLPDGSGFLWMTERTGAWSIERHAADGSHAATVMTADLGPRRVVGITPDGRDAIVEAAGEPAEQHVWWVPLTGGARIEMTGHGGVHTARTAHGVIAISSQLRAGGRAAAVIRPGGARAELASVAERPAAPPTTKFENLLLEDHAQLVAVTRPHAFDPRLRYPVVIRFGTSPETRSVLDALDTYALDQWYADAGFIVVRSDGRGTPGRDRVWQRAIAGDVLTLPMNDQLLTVRRLGARHPELDTARVAALGGEHGGHLAALAALIHPEAFAAAVAVSPITDWSLVDAATAERYLRTPATNPEGYRRAAAATYAEQLRRPLLLFPSVPGSRIAPAHAFSLIEALSAAGKRAEIAFLPDRPDAARRIASSRLVAEFFRRELGPPVRPIVMPAARDGDEDEERETR